MMVLAEGQVCPLSSSCEYNVNNSCMGATQGRITEFRCGYVENGRVKENMQQRNKLDQTGNMKVLME